MGKRVTFYLPDDLYGFIESLRRTEYGTISRSEVLKRILIAYRDYESRPTFYRVKRRETGGTA